MKNHAPQMKRKIPPMNLFHKLHPTLLPVLFLALLVIGCTSKKVERLKAKPHPTQQDIDFVRAHTTFDGDYAWCTYTRIDFIMFGTSISSIWTTRIGPTGSEARATTNSNPSAQNRHLRTPSGVQEPVEPECTQCHHRTPSGVRAVAGHYPSKSRDNCRDVARNVSTDATYIRCPNRRGE